MVGNTIHRLRDRKMIKVKVLMNLKQIKNSSTPELSISQLSHKTLCDIINKSLIGRRNL